MGHGVGAIRHIRGLMQPPKKAAEVRFAFSILVRNSIDIDGAHEGIEEFPLIFLPKPSPDEQDRETQ